MTEPLMWTSKGNLPVADLEYSSQWIIEENCIQFVQEYHYRDELVRRDVHICEEKVCA